MGTTFPKPKKEAIIYEDTKLYVCLANYPVTKGHTVVVWKKRVLDLHLLEKKEYEHIMNVVDSTRNAILKALKLKKVYLVYMDEANHVHWHLFPRFNEKGFDVFNHKPRKETDFSLAAKIKNKFSLKR